MECKDEDAGGFSGLHQRYNLTIMECKGAYYFDANAKSAGYNLTIMECKDMDITVFREQL